jgi:gamma-glutamyltranspeptidase
MLDQPHVSRSRAQSGAGAACAGGVVAAHPIAARAGANVLASGGNAADAAVAAAALLAVVDPANCGIGGYGGFAVVARPGVTPQQIAFNAVVPAAWQHGMPATQSPGFRVTPPAVIAGLCELGERFGTRPRGELWAQAVATAEAGFAVGRSLATALRWATSRHRGLNDAFRRTFCPSGQPLGEGEELKQPALAATLRRVAAAGADVIHEGTLVDDIVATVGRAGGALTREDFVTIAGTAGDAVAGGYAGGTVWMSDPAQCGSCIVRDTLASLDGVDLGERGGALYVDKLADALAAAWRRRDAAFRPLAAATSQTTHLSAVDASGMAVSMTFTHGPLWFGSGLLAEDTGVLLNCGSYLMARRVQDGAVVAQPHLAPVVIQRGGDLCALGTPGGRRIPAIVAQAIVDRLHYGVPIEHLWDGARLSTAADGALEAEPALADRFPAMAMTRIAVHEYYGPAGAAACDDGGIRGATDPRFDGAFVAAPRAAHDARR